LLSFPAAAPKEVGRGVPAEPRGPADAAHRDGSPYR